jgi:hypothetical protein
MMIFDAKRTVVPEPYKLNQCIFDERGGGGGPARSDAALIRAISETRKLLSLFSGELQYLVIKLTLRRILKH